MSTSGHHDGSSSRGYTTEQKAAVLRVRRCSPTAFYDILGLETSKETCTDAEIKKAYRKLSLLTHPDKNGHPHADEAFKMVSRAFQVLSDADKRGKYDRFGGDPESRFGAGGGGQSTAQSPFSGFGARSRGARAGGGGGGGGMWEEEISPEDLFRQFFGGGGGMGPFGGGLFDTGPGFMFNVGGGGPGVRIHQFGGARPRRRPADATAGPAQPASLGSAIQSLLPLLLLIILPLISSLFSGLGGSTRSSGPSVRLDAAVPPHTFEHVSHRLRVPYWVEPQAVAEYGSADWKTLDKTVEVQYVNKLSGECEFERGRRERMMQEARGFFWTDQVRMDEARRTEMRACKRLRELGYRVD